jgi:uncharacterized protein YdeI (YjbR/CyaY-like superfamily)
LRVVNELPLIAFRSQAAWAAWLAENHTTSPGLWLKLAKKGSGIPSVTYDEAVEEALCYGWIDGLKRPYDDQWWLQKFTPRGKKSMWSQINRDKAERLIAAGRMQPAGLETVESAKADGRWEMAYAGAANATVPDDLQAALDASPAAAAAFAALKKTLRYAILWRIHTAKRPETRARRIAEFVGRLERGEGFGP